ncbi:DUF429 domain-containing protein [Paenibacillus sp. LMG 31459]|uniref:DUF429 domain-containing protein n=1 Tax=Paenibacillus phytohabitans TaxID=2654978 RepID=A0ABX1YTM0_9BACL|nr:DUF429 domain-containing protein [Paenibacillus phytohabitans]NOU83909.1 DUF429 domain-containing protein [Paenibacillus phytohabitans]
MTKVVGIDVAGSENTWMCSLHLTPSHPSPMAIVPQLISLREIVEYCLNPKNKVKIIVIDAPLSYALNEEKGYRNCETSLRKNLRKAGFNSNFILSSNSLMGVTSRGRQLAEELRERGFSGEIIETIPRYCLAQIASFVGKKAVTDAVNRYKKKSVNVIQHREILWKFWRLSHFWKSSILKPSLTHKKSDGVIDAFVCATIGYLIANNPKAVHLERHVNNIEPIRGFVEGVHVLNYPFTPSAINKFRTQRGVRKEIKTLTSLYY